MLSLYHRLKSPDFWNMMNFVIEHTSPSAIVATGYLCQHIGEQVKSQLPRFVTHLLKIGNDYPFATLHSLRPCFIAGGKMLIWYANFAYAFTTAAIQNGNHQLLTVALKFLKTFNAIIYTQPACFQSVYATV
jgi:hypothetical protein